jgi:hypothetical protein
MIKSGLLIGFALTKLTVADQEGLDAVSATVVNAIIVNCFVLDLNFIFILWLKWETQGMNEALALKAIQSSEYHD